MADFVCLVPHPYYNLRMVVLKTSFLLLLCFIDRWYYCEAATSFFPKTSSTNNNQQPESKTSSTQVFVATGRHYVTPSGFWSPNDIATSQPKNKYSPKSIDKRKDRMKEISEYDVQSTMMKIGGASYVDMEWMNRVLPIITNVTLESLQIISSTFTSQLVQPIWQKAVETIHEQSLYSTRIRTISNGRVAGEQGLADPGDLLCDVDGWQAYFDREGTCLIYYFHKRSGISQWDVPHSNYPIPELSLEQLKLVAQKYRSTIAAEQEYKTHSETMSSMEQPKNSPSSSSSGLVDTLFNSLQDLIKRSSGNDNEPPDEKDNDDSIKSKPSWWSSVFDAVFDSGKSRDKPSDMMIDNDSTNGYNKNSIEMPFFATFRDQDNLAGTDIGTSSSKTFATNKESEIAERYSVEQIATSLSPWWDMLRDVVVSTIESSSKQQQQLPNVAKKAVEIRSEESLQKNAWDLFFPNKGVAKKTDTTMEVSNQLDVSEQDDKNTMAWISDLPMFLTRDASRTIPLFGLLKQSAALVFPESDKANEGVKGVPAKSKSQETIQQFKQSKTSDADRLKALEEKRYAASRARQANLRKTYGTIIHDRSPTVSLTSIKLNKNKASGRNVDWYKYLDD